MQSTGPSLARRAGVFSAVSLLLAAVAFAFAPVLMPVDYSWLSNSISESGAQGLDGAWLTRLGFLAFGLGVVVLSLANTERWRWPGAALCLAFGLLMLTVAAYSTEPWFDGPPFNEQESMLHSVAASAMGLAYGLGVLTVLLGDRRMHTPQRLVGAIAVVSSVAVPLAMVALPAYAGVLQRVMFAVAIVWFMGEAWRTARQAI